MSKLLEFAAMSKALGVRNGESAKDFRKRDPEAANKLAAFLRDNRETMAQEFANAHEVATR